ncbi:serine hydrolase [Allobranchiibius sp. GilTou73]|uniref:serine hydrolase domain-containing protein n=1 Tax=Allobranchiibius sp. GilTou73 TaxID=2904523 RepID=UPI001F3B95EB|nr:serine hydrolase domain-containing protein [Allobranchiibius sp. GilTou73]UIJ33955.1 beta-lactamase family protein [Allobranchiibius sp. GilTou73]
MSQGVMMIGTVLTVLGCLIWGAIAFGVGRWLLHRAAPARGDSALAAELGRLAGRRARRVAAVVVDLDVVPVARSAFIDADEDSRFEIGSVTKGMVGMLLAEAISRREASLDATLGDLLTETTGSQVGAVTLRELATHTSGLPRLPHSPAMVIRVLLGGCFGVDPYRGTRPASVITTACRQRLSGRGHYRYSNLGAALLGHGLARAADCDFATLLAGRVFAPLGMSGAGINAAGAVPRGWTSTGRRSSPWSAGGYGPAGGGVICTATDMVRMATALLDRTAPGQAAIEPIAVVEPGRANRSSGMFWIVDQHDIGRTMVWHNGQTGGYSAFFALYPQARRAVVVLADTANAAAQERIALGLTRWLTNTTVEDDTAPDRTD